MKDFDLSKIESTSSGLDAFFESQPTIITPQGKTASSAPKPARRVKIGSLQQLNGFQRVSQDTLIHKSTKDLWAIKKEGEEFYVERLFQDDGEPLKG